MNSKDQTPSSTPDPQWDDLVSRLQENSPDPAPEQDPGPPASQDSAPAADPEAGPPAAPPEELGPSQPPGAETSQEALRKLFNTGPAAPGPRDYAPEDEPEEGFVPQEPAALGSGDPAVTLAWVGAVGGPLGLLLCVIFFRNAPTALYLVLAVATLVGVGFLWRRLPKERDPGDDGARV